MPLMWFTQICRLQALISGYGATQGIFAVESAVNELAHKMGMDPVKIKELNMPVEGETLFRDITDVPCGTELQYGQMYGKSQGNDELGCQISFPGYGKR